MKDLYFGQKVMTMKGPGKVEKFFYSGLKVEKVQVKMGDSAVKGTFGISEVWPDVRTV